MSLSPLSIDALLPEIVSKSGRGGSVVLQAAPGAGKTTRVPPALYAAEPNAGRVIVVEPRRVAARAAARRVAWELGFPLGGPVGYHVRYERRATASTHILFVTEGILVRMLQADPFLEGIAAVVFDEFHERRLDSDLALAMVRRVQREARPDLKIAVMSATLDTAPVAAFLGNCPIVTSPVATYPLEILYLDRRTDGRTDVASAASAAARRAFARVDGDVLVFLPGVGEIRRTQAMLEDWATATGVLLCPLYGDLPGEAQDAALRRGERRRVVLATNVAETSVTVEGVRAVVDSGLARVPRFDPGTGLDRLELGRISRASANQRAGRAAREGPGLCLRLWTEAEQLEMMDVEIPEVRRVDLAGACLELLAWGEDPARFEWFEAPEASAIERARRLLNRLGAADARGLTELGRTLSRLPVHPRLSRLIVESRRLGCPSEGCLLAALLAERDPFEARAAVRSTDSDALDRMEALERGNGVRPPAARAVARARDQLARLLAEVPGPTGTATDSRLALRRALLAAYPDRVARRRAPGDARGVLVGGRGLRLHESSGVRDAMLFVCIDLDAGGRGPRAEALVRQASAIEADWLPLRSETVVAWDPERQRVVAEAREMYEDLAISSRSVSRLDPAEAAQLLEEAARESLGASLDLETPETARLIARINWLRQWMPELGLPAVDDDLLAGLLPALCAGNKSFAELRAAPLADFLRGSLTHAQLAALDREAPERIAVPSGSRLRLAYAADRPPVLAVRIQELFGLGETPRVASGRVAVLLHLLAPNGRPQQVTDDLGRFWRETYRDVRKELRGRYPKHDWPEDPTRATPTSRAKRR